MQTIDLRSDTVTKPTSEMLQYMFRAEVGDDVYMEDATVKELENKLSKNFGMESGIFCPSGTMSNQIAIKVQTQPGDEVICSDNAHIFKYEGGGMAFNSSVQARTIKGDRGRINASQIEEVINSDDVHFPISRLVCLENTNNRGGGSIYDIDELLRIKNLCNKYNLKLHLDGARIFNALIESNYSADKLGQIFDSISVCLSKGLGAPVGSVLLGSEAFIKKARRVRKVFGGGMRQAGYLAAAGIYALDNHIDRLKIDHQNAKKVAHWVSQVKGYNNTMDVETNIVIFEMENATTADHFHQYLLSNGVKCGKVSPSAMRFVFHLDIADEHMIKLEQIIASYKF